ncbi:unnamed protein product [Trichogramma brassicae]|uniref:Uncharacterized protein n=1 Tax=Trichogramma brassicae TaxID=86971 RepID=A0A6H5IFN1_9HYME|nr:unnamed protein product [Trichogramma brassicae]
MCVSSATTNTDQEASQTTSNDSNTSSSSNNNSNDMSVTDNHHRVVESSEKIQTTKSGLTKAKEKYMRLHDKMLEQERELARKREAEADSRLEAKLRRHDVWACGRRAAASIAARLGAHIDSWKDHKIYKSVTVIDINIFARDNRRFYTRFIELVYTGLYARVPTTFIKL